MRQTLKSLDDLKNVQSGALNAKFEQSLQEVLADMQDRPALLKLRKVVVTLTFVPVPDTDGGLLASVNFQGTVEKSIPKHRTRVLAGRAHGTAEVRWDDLSTDDAHQSTIDDELARKADPTESDGQ